MDMSPGGLGVCSNWSRYREGGSRVRGIDTRGRTFSTSGRVSLPSENCNSVRRLIEKGWTK